jgi:ABC-type uncharacterized transport system permease subunit
MESDGLAAIVVPLILLTLRQTTPLVLAGLGGIFSERVGVVNIALEGMMLIGGFVGIWVGQSAGVVAGLVAAILSGGLAGSMHLFMTQKLKMDHIISGVAINLLALNGTTYLLRKLYVMAEPIREASVPVTIPVSYFITLAFVLPFLAHFVLYKTAFGLRLRAVGESAESVRMAGLSPIKLRIVGLLISGTLGGLAGAYLALSQVGRFSDDMVSGRGFIALAAVVCGRWTPLGTALAALIFGFFDALQLQLQGVVHIPSQFLLMVPYVFTILAALVLRPTPPAALGKEETTE